MIIVSVWLRTQIWVEWVCQLYRKIGPKTLMKNWLKLILIFPMIILKWYKNQSYKKLKKKLMFKCMKRKSNLRHCLLKYLLNKRCLGEITQPNLREMMKTSKSCPSIGPKISWTFPNCFRPFHMSIFLYLTKNVFSLLNFVFRLYALIKSFLWLNQW